MDTSSTNWSDWFDRINTAALTWYGVYAQNQPAPVGTDPSASLGATRSGVQASISLPVLIVGAVVVIGAIYIYKKA